ncbi:MAG TPA: MoxR family ATPase [Thermoleophilia bacterium]|nr:MoxR family ATPase [Thermoleophilia bacterium]
MNPIGQIQDTHGIVGRDEELAMALAVLESGRHLLLEGPVGVGKTTVALAVCAHIGRSVVRVDGDDRYSESKLTGWFDPPLVLAKGYCDETFFAGPLVQAMRSGAVLFVNELNRMPEAVQNVLLPALDEGLLIVPRIGDVRAAPGFQVVATQNPVEYIATGHLSEALRDRFEHVGLDYQDEDEEIAIVTRETGCPDLSLIAEAVAVTRATRSDPRFRKGASVRAAIAMVAIAARTEGSGDALRRAAGAALPTRVELRDETDTPLPAVLDELVGEARKKA